jgi:hypothetical protein
MYRSIIHNNNRLWAGVRIAVRKNAIFDEIVKSFPINGATNHATSQISIDCECWKETDVLGPLCRHFGDNRAAFLSPSVSSLTKLRIDSRFVDKDELISSPFRELDKPMLPENRIAFSGFLLELQLVNKARINLFMVDIFLSKKTTQ